MNRRQLLRSFASLAGIGLVTHGVSPRLQAALQKMKITRIRYYHVPNSRPIFNQSGHIVTVETDQGITGIGEGGTKDSIEQLGAMLIGSDAARIEQLWQLMYRGYFYPPGREKLHALGALDLALWDIKGKALGLPVYELLGGLARDYVECYSTGYPNQGSLKDTARACIDAGFRAFRTSVADPGGEVAFDAQRMISKTLKTANRSVKVWGRMETGLSITTRD